MSLISTELKNAWGRLRASKPQRKFSLEEIRIKNFRGIKDLRVVFQSPVSVLAGANGCGKTTVLLAAACAYQPAGAASMALTPASCFPPSRIDCEACCRISSARPSSPITT